MTELSAPSLDDPPPLPAADGALVVDVAVEHDDWSDRIPGAAEICADTLTAALSFLPGHLPGLEVSVALVDDATIRDLNRRFRGMDKPTNVLSFPALDAPALGALERGERPADMPPGAPVVMGDLALALETLEREAAAQGKELPAHFRHLLLHGFLHLFGYDHLDDEQAETMERLEARILGHFGLPDPYDPDPVQGDDRPTAVATDKCND